MNFHGNYTGTVKLESGIEDSLYKGLKESSSKNGMYYLRSKDLLTSNSACLLLRSNLAHSIAVTIDQERGSLESLTVFPDGIYDAGIDLLDCTDFDAAKPSKIKTQVVVTTVQELPSPDTVSYLQRLEEEKRARQHGAAQDNRSFLAKY
uniref:Uncharacterized protein n=1 Tax=Panagrolaimus sp. JU765 TaxID=591449 RepID=A0AC34R985_9BILA